MDSTTATAQLSVPIRHLATCCTAILLYSIVNQHTHAAMLTAHFYSSSSQSNVCTPPFTLPPSLESPNLAHKPQPRPSRCGPDQSPTDGRTESLFPSRARALCLSPSTRPRRRTTNKVSKVSACRLGNLARWSRDGIAIPRTSLPNFPKGGFTRSTGQPSTNLIPVPMFLSRPYFASLPRKQQDLRQLVSCLEIAAGTASEPHLSQTPISMHKSLHE